MPFPCIGVVIEATSNVHGKYALWLEYTRAGFSTSLLAFPTLQQAGYYMKAMHACPGLPQHTAVVEDNNQVPWAGKWSLLSPFTD